MLAISTDLDHPLLFQKIFCGISLTLTFAPIANQNLFKMKKLLLPLALVAFVLAGTSCKKEYVCTCEAFGVSVSSEPAEYSKSEADDAEAACETVDSCTFEEV